MAKASADFSNQVEEAEEFEEVTGGDFPRVHDFDENDTFVGTFVKSGTVTAKGKERVIHSFTVDGEDVQVWGTAILDSRLDQLNGGERVKLIRRGKVPTKTGNTAWDWSVYVARSAFRGA